MLSSEYPEQILPILLARYGCPVQGTEDSTAAVTRMKLGEVLMRVTRALGESLAALFSHWDIAKPLQGAAGCCPPVLSPPKAHGAFCCLEVGVRLVWGILKIKVR